MQRLTLAQQIAQLETTAPTDFDPEDIYQGNANDHVAPGNTEDVDMDAHDPNAGREHYVDVGPSELRKLRESVADPKYDSIKTSRHQLHTNEDDSEEEDGDRSQLESQQNEGTPSLHSDSLSSASEDEEIHSPMSSGATKPKMDDVSTQSQDPDPNLTSNQDDETLTSSLQRTRLVDKLKGKAVSRQLKIWDSLVDARIRIQKCVATANKLPHPEKISPYVSSNQGRVAARRFLTESLMLSDELFELRHTLLIKAGFAQPPLKKRRIDPEQVELGDLDLESLVNESTADMVAFDVQTHPYSLSTLQKWSTKVQAVTPLALLQSSRTTFKSGPAHLKGAAELVEDALREQGKLVKRTWGKFNPEARIGGITVEETEIEGDEETYDDKDFYQAMLRDVIESKGSKDGIDVADLYANSKKQQKRKNVDTKASKGRKIRYEPHEKLQNFMVPVPVRGGWHEEKIDELFASLLGKGFEGTE